MAGTPTIHRNDLVPVEGGRGQRAVRQINTLAGLGRALGPDQQPLWTWRNGYALCSAEGLAGVSRQLAVASAAEIDHLRGLLRIGLHWDVEVTDARHGAGPLVSQACCCSDAGGLWPAAGACMGPLARLVLEAAYEATLLAPAAVPCVACSSRGWAAGRSACEPAWITSAIERALVCVAGQNLDVLAVSR